MAGCLCVCVYYCQCEWNQVFVKCVFLHSFQWVFVCVYAYLCCTSNTVVVYIQYVCLCLHDCLRLCMWVSPGCLGA